jgi:hypothetical protein
MKPLDSLGHAKRVRQSRRRFLCQLEKEAGLGFEHGLWGCQAVGRNSKLGRGTTVTLYFPGVRRSSAKLAKVLYAAAYPTDLRGIVLIVEDEAKPRKLAARAVGKVDYTGLSKSRMLKKPCNT